MSEVLTAAPAIPVGQPSSWHETSAGCVHQLFEEKVRRTPSAVAAICRGHQISYNDLNAMANRLARVLIEQGVGMGDTVAIVMGRSTPALASYLGALKAGATYVPIDTSLPARRIGYILRDSGASHLLVDGRGRARLDELDTTPFNAIDVETAMAVGNSSDLNLDIDPAAAAYCIYTSGSTGEPKGVLVRHSGLTNYILWARAQYCTQGISSFAFYSSPSFDLTVTSIYVPLIAGLTVHVYPEGNSEIPLVLDVVMANEVDLIKLTPSHLELLREVDLAGSRLKTLIVGGEDLKGPLALSIHQKLGGRAAIFNEYGPTETVVGCMVHRFDPVADASGSVPIGRPIAATQIYLLDERGEPVVSGQVGEIHVGGAGVAIGYRGKPEITNECFVEDTFMPGSRLYVTGDLGREDTSGRLTFLGRADTQIKLRGYRVELGEIENSLRAYPGIRDCVVTTTAALHAGFQREGLRHCTRCGMASNFPGTIFSADGVCSHCHAYDAYKGVVDDYFGNLNDLIAIFEAAKTASHGAYDCIVALSGGKDSTYALCRVVDMGMRVLAYTLDNGFISDCAKANIDHVVGQLKVDHRYLTTPHMNEIFVDSINRHSNPCNGCFKTIYTMGINLACEVGVDTIVMGLSKGQLFETRLQELFRSKEFNSDAFERNLIEARKIYHRIDDAPKRLLDTSCVTDDAVLETMRFVDFYRYCHVSREEMYRYIETCVGWSRPGDTGRSTNCLLNDVGIYLHKSQRGYHNYSLPYSWDVRVGHVPRDEAIQELDDTDLIDERKVSDLLEEIGYDTRQQEEQQAEVRLICYYVSSGELDPAHLKDLVAAELPDYMVPRVFLRLDQMPLTPNGKINRRALPRPNFADRRSVAQAEPRSPVEEKLAAIWRRALITDSVDVEANFFEAGGHSLSALMLLYNVAETFGATISIQEFAVEPTFNALSRHLAATAT